MTADQAPFQQQVERLPPIPSCRQIEKEHEGKEIPETPYYELPSSYNEAVEKNRAERQLLDEKIETALCKFYEIMNQSCVKLGLKNSHFAVAHGMHHPNNYSCAHDIAILSRVAL